MSLNGQEQTVSTSAQFAAKRTFADRVVVVAARPRQASGSSHPLDVAAVALPRPIDPALNHLMRARPCASSAQRPARTGSRTWHSRGTWPGWIRSINSP